LRIHSPAKIAFGNRGYPNRRSTVPVTNTAAAGSQTHLNSLSNTRIPHSEKNPRPMGETWIGRQEKKNLSLLKGAHKAIPRPPFVSMSSSPCDNVDRNKKMKVNP
jgi:hypothetical protein